MQLGMIGLGRMGANMVRRLMRKAHTCVVHDTRPKAVALHADGAVGTASIGSWLLDLTAGALLKDPQLEAYGGRVSDSGEGRWTLQAGFANQLLSAMRHAFGGHLEKPAEDAR